MTLAQQIQTLQGRGLMIADTNKAEQALDAISYFRLADYWYHLEADHHTHQFLPNSHFEEVLACYFFDKDLKALLFKAIQTIEVAVRSKVIKHFAPTCGPFWFMDATKAVNQRRFQTNLETIKKEVGRSKERYIREYGNQYVINSPKSAELMRLFHRTCEQNGIMHDNDLIFEYLSQFEEKNAPQQLSLWD